MAQAEWMAIRVTRALPVVLPGASNPPICVSLSSLLIS